MCQLTAGWEGQEIELPAAFPRVVSLGNPNLKILPMCRACEQFALLFGVIVFMTCCRDGLVCHLLTQHLLATSPPLMFSHFSFERCLDGRFTPPTTSWVASR